MYVKVETNLILYEKVACKMLVKLTPGINFINILCTTFLYKCVLIGISLVEVGFVTFYRKNNSAKAARKMLLKLTKVLHLSPKHPC